MAALANAHFRWSVLTDAGLFFGKPYCGHHLLILKLAITANALGILFGSIAVYGEAKLAIGFRGVFADNELNKLARKDFVPTEQLSYELPWWIECSEVLFYSLLLSTVILWVFFIWLA